jgi:hypothetical protein
LQAREAVEMVSLDMNLLFGKNEFRSRGLDATGNLLYFLADQWSQTRLCRIVAINVIIATIQPI